MTKEASLCFDSKRQYKANLSDPPPLPPKKEHPIMLKQAPYPKYH